MIISAKALPMWNKITEINDRYYIIDNNFTWYWAVSLLVTEVSATYPFSIAVSGLMLSWSPDTTRTDKRVTDTRSLPTLTSFAPITLPVSGESTCTSVRPTPRPCTSLLWSNVAILGSETRSILATRSVTRSQVRRLTKYDSRPVSWSFAKKRACTSTGLCWNRNLQLAGDKFRSMVLTVSPHPWSFPLRKLRSSCSSSSRITSGSSTSMEVSSIDSSSSTALLFFARTVTGDGNSVEDTVRSSVFVMFSKLRLLLEPAACSSDTFQPFIWLNRVSPTVTSRGNSGIHTVNLAKPVYVPYLTRTDALLEPLISEPSTYTLLQEDDT